MFKFNEVRIWRGGGRNEVFCLLSLSVAVLKGTSSEVIFDESIFLFINQHNGEWTAI